MPLVLPPVSPFTRVFARRVAPALCAAMLLADPIASAAQGVAGPYLAAEQASRRGDLSSAASQYARALARDPGNIELLERALLHRLAAGGVPPAVALARQLSEKEEVGRAGQHLAAITLAAEELAKGHAKEAGTALRRRGGCGERLRRRADEALGGLRHR